MNGGLSQDVRILRLVDAEYTAELAMLNRAELEAFNRASHSDALRELQIVPAEELQPEYDPPIGDPIGLIQSLGWRRIVGAVAFMAVTWGGTAVFAVMFGGGQ